VPAAPTKTVAQALFEVLREKKKAALFGAGKEKARGVVIGTIGL